ncbi:MAG: hypothetical protein HY020_26585 [Burkholderiales bacterium]|nr:hypothetical protein [Burkholderiales bacterium]
MSGRWLSIGPLAALGGGGVGHPPSGGPVTCLAVVERRVYAGTRNGGVWRSDDGGESWWSTMGAEGDAPGEGFDPNQPVPHGDGLAIGAIAIAPGDPDRVYAGIGVSGADADDLTAYAGVGIAVSFNGGITWTRETGNPDLTGARVRAIAVDGADPDFAVAATDRGLYQRNPGSGTWERSTVRLAGPPDGPGTDVSGDDFTDLVRATSTIGTTAATTWYAARRGGPVFRSVDVGHHFDEFGSALTVAAGERVRLACSAAQADLAYALTGGAVLQVLDNTAAAASTRTAWITVGGTPLPADLLGAAADKRAETTLALVADPAVATRVYLGGHQRMVGSEAVAYIARCEIAVVGVTRSAVTQRFGDHAHAGVTALAIAADRSTRLWVGTMGGVWSVADATIPTPIATARNHGLASQMVTALTQHPTEAAYLLAATLGNGLVRSEGEPVWTVVRRAEATGRAVIIAPKSDGTTHLRIAVALGRDIQRSDGGDLGVWNSIFTVPPGEPLGLAINHAPQPVLVNVPIGGGSPADSERLVLATDSLRFSDDAGATWAAPTPVITAAAVGSGDLWNRRAVRCAGFLDRDTLALGLNNGEVYRFTRNGDGSWTKQRIDNAGGLPGGGARITAAVTCITALPGGGTDKMLVCFAGAGGHDRVWRYDHASAAPKWSARMGPPAPSDDRLPALPVNALAAWQASPADPTHWFAGTDDGLWRSTDEGAHWARHDEGLPDAAVIDLAVHATSGLIRAATAGRGVYERPLAADAAQVELVLRNHPLDLRRPDGQALPRLDPVRTAVLADAGQSPDLRFDAPDGALAYQLPVAEPIDAVDFAGLTDEGGTIPVAGTPVPVMVHVQVHNRGVSIADHVSVALLVARHDGADLIPQLPSHYPAHVALGTTMDDLTWTVLDRITVHGVAAGRPAIASFVVEASAFAAADGFKATVIALVHHADDPYANAERAPAALSAAERKSARRIVVGRNFALAPAPAATQALHGWTAIGPAGTRRGQTGTRDNPVSGRVTGIAVAPNGNRVYVATANGGVWRSDDRGRRWRPLDQFDADPLPGAMPAALVGLRSTGIDTQACGAIAIDDAHPDRVYLGTGEGNSILSDSFRGIGPLCSDDGGEHWIPEATTPAGILMGQVFYGMAVDPANREQVVAGTSDGLFVRSTAAAGAPGNWAQILPAPPAPGTPDPARQFTGITVAAAGGTTTFFAANIASGVFASSTPTVPASWIALPAVPDAADRKRLAIAASLNDASVLFAVDDQGRVYRTSQAGGAWAAWAKLDGVPGKDDFVGKQGGYDLAIQVDPHNRNRVYLAGCCQKPSLLANWAGSVYRCVVTPAVNRLSATYIGNGVHPDCHALAMPRDDSNQLWVGCDGGVYLAEDVLHGDEPFVPRNAGIASMTFVSFACHPTEPAVVFASAQDNGGQLGTGEETFQLGADGDGGYGWVHPTEPNRVISTYTYGETRRSSDGGRHGSFSGTSNPNGFEEADQGMFYAPLVGMPPGTPAGQAGQIAFGHKRLFFSEDFGGSWRSLPGNDATTDRIATGPIPANVPGLVFPTGNGISAVSFIDGDTLVAGTLTGAIHRYVRNAGAWTRTELYPGTPPLPALWRTPNPITDIEPDPRPGQAGSFFVTLGGSRAGAPGPARIWHFANATSTWTDLSGNAGTPIIDAQANAVTADLQGANLTLFVGMDIGVWACTSPFPAAANMQVWTPVSQYLPDCAVVDLKLVPGSRLLRAALYGRGLFDLDLARGVPGAGVQAQAVELYLRAHQLDLARLDQGRAPRVYGHANPLALDKLTAFGDAPDIRIDRPDGDGAYQLPLDHDPDFVTFVDRLTDHADEVRTHDRSLVNRVYVQIHNRGPKVADRVRVALWLAPRNGANPPDLPADYRARLKLQSPVIDDNWKVVGYREANGVRSTSPQVLGFDLRSDLLPRPGELSGHEQWSLLVLLDHDDDPWRSDTVAVHALCDNEAKAVSKAIIVGSFSGRHPTAARFVARPYLRHLAVALAMQERLASLDAAMAARVAGPHVSDLDRRLAFLSHTALSGARTGDRVPQAVETPAVVHLTKFHLAGLRAWEWADDIDRLEASAGWIEDVLHRGSVDANLSLQEVPAGRFILRVAELSWDKATGKQDVQRAIVAFVNGMAAALASEVVLRPVLAGQEARQGAFAADHRHPTGAGLAVERWVSQALLNGSPEREGFAAWWPGAGELPQELLDGFIAALLEVYAPAGRTGLRFHDAPELPMAVPSAKDLREGHGVFLSLLETGFGAGWWWLILLPMVLAPSVGLIMARSLRGAGDRANALLNEVPAPDDNPAGERKFEPGTERDWSDLVGSQMLCNSITPFVYSMILWGVLPRRGVTGGLSLGTFLGRALSAGFFLGTRSDGGAGARWGSVLPQLSLDVAWIVNAIRLAATQRPGQALQSLLQGMPLIQLATGSLFALMLEGGSKSRFKSDAGFWLWLLFYTIVNGVVVGLPIALGLDRAGGALRYFGDRVDPDIGPTATLAAREPRPALGHARVMPAGTGWDSGDSADGHARYAADRRVLLKLWYGGAGAVTVRQGRDRLSFQHDADAAVEVLLAEAVQASGLAALIESAMPDLHAAVASATDPEYYLPWPATVDDPGDTATTLGDHRAHRDDPVTLSHDGGKPTWLHHAPRRANSVPVGVPGASPLIGADRSLRLLPERGATVADLAGTAIADAGDLAAILAMGLVPSLDGRATPVPGIVGAGARLTPVQQVFRRWNLDERSQDEWRQLFGPGAGGPDAINMGWIPLIRAWSELAGNPALDAMGVGSPAGRPASRIGQRTVRPTGNRTLSEAMRTLLDLPALPPL